MARLFSGSTQTALGLALCLALGTGCAGDDGTDVETDAGLPDPAPAAASNPAINVCAGCGIALSADYTLIQQIFPYSPTHARSADFTMELLTAPRPEARP